MEIRERALPRGWYPGTAEKCKIEIDDFLKGYHLPPGSWRGGIVPHAGWYFSGKLAARVIRTLSGENRPDRIVIYGGHLPSSNSPVAYKESFWETPLGPITMDTKTVNELTSRNLAVSAPRGFSDNTIEINLPFIKYFFDGIPVIAVHSPASDRAVELAESVRFILAEQGLWAVYLGSADLTHYGPNYGFMPKGIGPDSVAWVKAGNDKSLIDKALAMDAGGVLTDAAANHNTCSAGPIASVIASVLPDGVQSGLLIDYYTSHDVMPDASFVGYAGIVY